MKGRLVSGQIFVHRYTDTDTQMCIHVHTHPWMHHCVYNNTYAQHTCTRDTLPSGFSAAVGQELAISGGRHLTPS